MNQSNNEGKKINQKNNLINYLHDIEDQSAAATHGISTIRETLIKAINNHNMNNDDLDEFEENLQYTLRNTQTLIKIIEGLQNKVDSDRRKVGSKNE